MEALRWLKRWNDLLARRSGWLLVCDYLGPVHYGN